MEPVGEAADAVVGGLFDSEFDAEHPSVVLLILNSQDGKTHACSGTLVTPRWVLTAAHCIEETTDGAQRDSMNWTVFVSPQGNRATGAQSPKLMYSAVAPNQPNTRAFIHTLRVSGVIPTLDGPDDPIGLRDEDLALVRLDRRVPHPIGLPAALPTAYECTGPCEDVDECGFSGKLVGFSPYGFDGDGYLEICPRPGGF